MKEKQDNLINLKSLNLLNEKKIKALEEIVKAMQESLNLYEEIINKENLNNKFKMDKYYKIQRNYANIIHLKKVLNETYKIKTA